MKSRRGHGTKLILRDTYFAAISGSIGSKLFRHLYARVGGKKIDILKNGNLSCAFFVSSLLVLFGLLKNRHATVAGTIKDLKKSGWKTSQKPKRGDVLVWEAIDFGNGNFHEHIGFYIGENRAISNSYKKGCPKEHHWDFNGKRKVVLIFTNPKYVPTRKRGAI